MALPDESSPESEPAKPPQRVSLFAIYRTFFWIGLFSFGGGLSAWTHREIVLVRGWMTNQEFFSGYSLGQILPGVNSTNLSVYVGQHLRGAIGAVTALGGMLTGPFVVVILAAITYDQLSAIPGFQIAMEGVAAAAIGLLLRMAISAGQNAARGVVSVVIMAATFVAIAILKLPLLLVAAVMAPISVYASWPRGS